MQGAGKSGPEILTSSRRGCAGNSVFHPAVCKTCSWAAPEETQVQASSLYISRASLERCLKITSEWSPGPSWLFIVFQLVPCLWRLLWVVSNVSSDAEGSRQLMSIMSADVQMYWSAP